MIDQGDQSAHLGCGVGFVRYAVPGERSWTPIKDPRSFARETRLILGYRVEEEVDMHPRQCFHISIGLIVNDVGISITGDVQDPNVKTRR
jgi:hypothetical protein